MNGRYYMYSVLRRNGSFYCYSAAPFDAGSSGSNEFAIQWQLKNTIDMHNGVTSAIPLSAGLIFLVICYWGVHVFWAIQTMRVQASGELENGNTDTIEEQTAGQPRPPRVAQGWCIYFC